MIIPMLDGPEPILKWDEAKKQDEGEKSYVESLVKAAQSWFDRLDTRLGPPLQSADIRVYPRRPDR